MRAIRSFSLEKHEGPYDRWPRRSRLYRDGVDTGRKVPGYCIEAQYEWEHGYLLITSQDCPFEESNDFLLLDRSLRCRWRWMLLTPYGSWLLDDHWPVAERKLALHYFPSEIRILTVRDFPFGLGPWLTISRPQDPASVPGAQASIARGRARGQFT